MHTPPGNTNDVDFAGGTPLSVIYFSPDTKIIISPDGGHAWTAFPENAAGFNAGLFTYTANASSIVRTTDAGNALFGLNDAAFVASTGISNGAVTKSHKANETVAYAPQAGRVYASMDSSLKDFQVVSSESWIDVGCGTDDNCVVGSTLTRTAVACYIGSEPKYVHHGES
jgi:hypothetical protein